MKERFFSRMYTEICTGMQFFTNDSECGTKPSMSQQYP
jgi:hypothetical protein